MEDPGGLYESMSSRQFRRWIEYAQLEPFGEDRDDWRAGLVTSAIYNVNIDPRKSKQLDPTDFMPKFGANDNDDNETDDDVLDVNHRVDDDNSMTQAHWDQLKREVLIAAGQVKPT